MEQTWKISDADSHLMEPLDFLTSYADPRVRDRLPKIIVRGWDDFVANAVRQVRDPELRAKEVVELEKNVLGGPKGWKSLGGFLPAERTRALDILGFEYQLVFSTFANTAFFFSDDPEIAYGGARAHNRAMHDFCRHDSRLLPVGGLPITDPELAVREIRAAAREGTRVFWLPLSPLPGGESPGHFKYDPIWRELEAIGGTFVLHTSSERHKLSLDYVDNGLPQQIQGTRHEGEAFSAKDIIARHFRAELFIASMVYDGAFKRFPKLTAGVIEVGACWVPNFLERLDDGAKIFRNDPSISKLDMKPSDYVRRNIKFTPFWVENTALMIKSAGPDLFMFSSDYPHPEGGTAPIAAFDRQLNAIEADAETRRKFYSANMKQMLHLA